MDESGRHYGRHVRALFPNVGSIIGAVGPEAQPEPYSAAGSGVSVRRPEAQRRANARRGNRAVFSVRITIQSLSDWSAHALFGNCAQRRLFAAAKIAGQRSTGSGSASGPGKSLCNRNHRQRSTAEFSVHAFSPRRGRLSRLLDDRLGDEASAGGERKPDRDIDQHTGAVME